MLAFKLLCIAFVCASAAAYATSKNDNDGDKNETADGQEANKEETDPKPNNSLEWWQNGLFYQIYPRSFKDSDGDGIGDIRGIIEKLDYLQELGIDATWLSPIFKSPMKDFGYDISDFRTIDPIFGKMEDLEELFEKANAKSIPIILDFVPNHSSDQHEWFQKSVKRDPKYDNYYIWADGKNDNRDPPNNWVSIFYGPAWTFNKERGQWYYHQFTKEQPDLNYRNEAVLNEMLDVLRFWLEKGAGGFRIDAVNHLFEYEDLRDEPLSGMTKDPKSYDYTLHEYTKDLPEMYETVYKFRKCVDDFQKEKGGPVRVLMTEAYTNRTEYPKYFKNADGSKLGSHIPFNFGFITDMNKDSTAEDFHNTINKTISSVPEGTRLNWVVGNHDKPRVASRFGERKNDALITLALTMPGIAVTYNGEEIGMLDNREGISYKDTHDPAACNLKETDNWRELSRDPERTPFQWDSSNNAGFMPANATKDKKPWLPIHPNYVDINVELQKNFERSNLKYYKQLVQLRKEPAFATGTFESQVIDDNVFAYIRAQNDSDSYVVLINFGAREEVINVANSTVKNMHKEVEVAAASVDSAYSAGDKVVAEKVLLRRYDTVILKVANSAGFIVASITLTIGLLTVSMARTFF